MIELSFLHAQNPVYPIRQLYYPLRDAYMAEVELQIENDAIDIVPVNDDERTRHLLDAQKKTVVLDIVCIPIQMIPFAILLNPVSAILITFKDDMGSLIIFLWTIAAFYYAYMYHSDRMFDLAVDALKRIGDIILRSNLA